LSRIASEVFSAEPHYVGGCTSYYVLAAAVTIAQRTSGVCAGEA